VGRLALRLLAELARFYTTIICLAYLALAALGLFSADRVILRGPTPGMIALFGLLLFLLAWRIAVLALAPPGKSRAADRVELAVVIQVIVMIVLQVTGGLDSPIFPLFYLGSAMMVYFLDFLPSLAIALAALIVFAVNVGLEARWADHWAQLSAAVGFAVVFNLAIAAFIKGPRERAQRTQTTLDRLTAEAERAARERSTGASALSRDRLARSDLGALLQVDRVLGDLADLAKRALSASASVIAMVGDEPDSLVVRAVAADEQPPANYLGAEVGQTVLAEALAAGGTIRLAKLDGELRGRRRHRDWGQKPKSLAASPLVEADRIIGVIAADSQYEDHFGREEERFLAMMARQAAAAIARERLYRDVSTERAEFAAFYDLIKKMGASIELDTVSRVILESVQDVVGYDYGVLVRVDLELRQGAIEAVAGLPEETWRGATISLPDSLVGWVIGSKTYLHYPDLRDRAHPTERRRPVFSRELSIKDLGSLLCLPLVRQNFVTGLLVFGATEANAFTNYEIKILEVVAVQAGVSLENARVHAEMEKLAVSDGLTGCFNHRYFQDWLESEIQRAVRMPIAISMVLCDIDHFKKFNDTYGHPLGDQVLKTVTGVFRANVRKNDLAARYGGEEFALVLLNSDRRSAVKFADRVRQAVAKTKIDFAGEKLGVTVSMGVATFPDDAREKAALIELADKALYAAKQGGRNRVVHAQELTSG
jgi:diguanylate cyclase (GGDEF)-like protein